MTDFIEISGRIASGLVINPGTIVEVVAGGTAVDTLIKAGGSEIVASGGFTISTTVRAGGSELVSSGGTAAETGVKDGGYLEISSGGSAVSAAVSAGGTMIVSGGGTAIDTGSGAAAFVSVTSVVSAGEVVSGLVIGPDTALDVASGGTALDITVSGGGVETVESGGWTSDITVGNEGSVAVLAGGSAAEAFVSSGGSFIVSAGGWASDYAVSSGGFGSVRLLVGQGQVTSGLVVDSVTTLVVGYRGVTSDTTITSGGSVLIGTGTDISATISAGGYEEVEGFAFAPVISGALVTDGIVSGAMIGGDGIEIVSSGLPADLGVTSNTTISGSGTLEIEDGGSASGTIVFDDAGRLVLDSGSTFAVLSGFGAGNSIDLEGYAYSSGATASFDDGELVVSEGGTVAALVFAGDYDGAAFALSADAGGGTLVTVTNVPCFAAGTLIDTPEGLTPVEALAPGDEVLTIEGTAEPVVWIGSRRVECARHPEPARVRPVRIEAHAFGPGRPARTLFLSPDHAVFAEGVLIPVKHLLNGSTIRQVAAQRVTYLHVELPRHAVILAEGLPVESYLDTGDRRAFSGAAEATLLHPVFGAERPDAALILEALACAPLRVTGPEVERLRAGLARRAAERSVAAGKTA